jgi:hypothetical protein
MVPAEPEIRNPKCETRNKFKKMEISKRCEKEELGNFFAACGQFGLLQCSNVRSGQGATIQSRGFSCVAAPEDGRHSGLA